MPRWLVLLNQAAGTLADSAPRDAAGRIVARLAGHGIEAEARACPGDRLGPVCREALAEPFDVFVAAGGDGTAAAVAAALLGTGRPLGVLPLGTFNHFAKDLGVPLDLDEAVDALAGGEVREVPVGELDGRPFLNFSAVGLHPELAEAREAQRRAGRGRRLAVGVALVRALRRFPLLVARLELPSRRLTRVTPSVVVCINAYQMRAFGVADASYPDRRVLNVYVARARRPLDLARLVARALVGHVERTPELEAIATTALDLNVGPGRVRVSLDGELLERRSPLRYRIAADPLRVLTPRGAAPPP